MGTRADFYLGRNPETMRWLGSIAYDGYPQGHPEVLLGATREFDFIRCIEKMRKIIKKESKTKGYSNHFTSPGMGWPWPWKDSDTTDYAYAFDNGKVYFTGYENCDSKEVRWFHFPWHTLLLNKIGFALDEKDKIMDSLPVKFPNMAHIQKVSMDERSGLMFLRSSTSI